VNSRGYLTVTVSFEKFQSKLIDAWGYLRCRTDYAFGSVRDPETGNSVYKNEYINIDLAENESEEVWEIKQIAEALLEGKQFVVRGHYGVGKSMALKEIYKILSKKYTNKLTFKFPVYVNLRDHHGQINPVEALERHARNIGFKHPDHLVRAWRAGYVTLILDGFDEIAVFGWAGKTTKLKEIRYKSMELLRGFVKQNPFNCGFVIAGRINYFDSIRECENALSLMSSIKILSIGDFSRAQVEKYFQKTQKDTIVTSIPEWLPSRPLLLGYLVSRNILSDAISDSNLTNPADGWDYLLDQITKREAEIEAGLSPQLIREIIEGISSFARKYENGLGPIYQQDLEKVFYDKCGYQPDDRALMLLQRLPGLGSVDQQDGSRFLIDQNFADVAKAGDVLKYIYNPYQYSSGFEPRGWFGTLNDLGVQVLSNKLENENSGMIEEAIILAKRSDADVLSIDILMSLNQRGESWLRESITFSGAFISRFEIKKDIDWSRVNFYESIFREVFVEEIPDENRSPRFIQCYFGSVIGCSDDSSFSENIFIDCEYDFFEVQETTTSALLGLDLPTPVKVGFTILKKLYLQSGVGRQENAFYRGLSTNEQRYVNDVLKILKQENLVYSSKRNNANNVWLPVKEQLSRVKNIMLNRALHDNILDKLKLIQ